MTLRTTSPRRIVPVACIALLVACGPSSDDLDAGPTLTLSSTGGQRNAALSESSAGDKMSSRVYAPEFDLTAAITDAERPDRASGYRATAAVDTAVVARIASAFDLTSAPVADDYGFAVEDEGADGVRSSLYVDRFGGWWYSSYAEVGCVEPASPTSSTDVTATCTPVAPRASGTITEQDARTAAAAIFAAAGRSDLSLEVTVVEDTGFGENVYVNGIETIGGYKTGRTFEVGFTAGRLSWASGTVAELVELGSYDLATTDVIAGRLADWRYSTWGAYDPQYWLRATTSATAVAEPAVAVGEGTTGDAQEGGPDVSAAESGKDLAILPDPAAGDDVGRPRVVLDSLEVVLGPFYQGDETFYLPSFHLTGPDGSSWTVLAVVDGVIEFAEPQPVAVEPLPEPAAPPMGDSDGGDLDWSVSDIDVTTVVGLTEQAAYTMLESAGRSVRIVARDGEQFPATMDYLPDRVNLTIVDGVVVDAVVG